MAKLLIFNWKMNPETVEEAVSLAKASDYENTVIVPPFLFIEEVGKVLKKAKLGAQDVAWADKGAFTGEVSAQELKNLCVEYVIIGHSERRHKLGETDEVIAKKMKSAVDAGLTPILCVGETEKESGIMNQESRMNYIKNQLEQGLKYIHNSSFLIRNSLIVAYEPVWAIGTGNSESPESALKTIKFIKDFLRPTPYGLRAKVLYGGSVDSKNLNDYLSVGGRSSSGGKYIDGALVGGASLKVPEIEGMLKLI